MPVIGVYGYKDRITKFHSLKRDGGVYFFIKIHLDLPGSYQFNIKLLPSEVWINLSEPFFVPFEGYHYVKLTVF